jgi:hypothetical protein
MSHAAQATVGDTCDSLTLADESVTNIGAACASRNQRLSNVAQATPGKQPNVPDAGTARRQRKAAQSRRWQRAAQQQQTAQ